ncbi:hypothetical protein FF38_00964 [Lucilia cuprina]|uniref:Uncharacterized protein n=1 Tax=Lucilia cuprina TaxID=7375 RepID=A0A0L0BUF7_LUCCU|nr:hypothetical protein FF38_00964 [Lucilia cuprina]
MSRVVVFVNVVVGAAWAVDMCDDVAAAMDKCGKENIVMIATKHVSNNKNCFTFCCCPLKVAAVDAATAFVFLVVANNDDEADNDVVKVASFVNNDFKEVLVVKPKSAECVRVVGADSGASDIIDVAVSVCRAGGSDNIVAAFVVALFLHKLEPPKRPQTGTLSLQVSTLETQILAARLLGQTIKRTTTSKEATKNFILFKFTQQHIRISYDSLNSH